ncbi:MAG: hypothetical protein J6U53_02260 [Tidjanibacter sp.]|nr:hypothetical protein [Tidjanibacter sp.]
MAYKRLPQQVVAQGRRGVVEYHLRHLQEAPICILTHRRLCHHLLNSINRASGRSGIEGVDEGDKTIPICHWLIRLTR